MVFRSLLAACLVAGVTLALPMPGIAAGEVSPAVDDAGSSAVPAASASLPSTGVSRAAQPAPLVDSASILVPSWAQKTRLSGTWEVWVAPMVPMGTDNPWNAKQLQRQVNADLKWFTRMSSGRFSIKATRVLRPAFYPRPVGSGQCAALRNTWHDLLRLRGSGNVIVVAVTELYCPEFAGLAVPAERQVLLADVPENGDVSAAVVRHEIGHVLGLPHASGYKGGLLSFDKVRRPLHSLQEYGDKTDVMGSGTADRPIGVFGLAALGWADRSYVVPTAKAAQYNFTLPASSRPGGPDAVVVTDPRSKVRYAFTYQSIDKKAYEPPVARVRGVFLHEIRYQDSGSPPASRYSRSYAYFLPWDPEGLAFGAGTGTSWVSPSGAVELSVGKTSARNVRLSVRVDPAGGLRDRRGPSWTQVPSVSQTLDPSFAVLTVYPAWDQSGIDSYRVTVGGRAASMIGGPPRNGSDVSLVRFAVKGSTPVVVTVTDTAGNSTTWRTTFPPRRNAR